MLAQRRDTEGRKPAQSAAALAAAWATIAALLLGAAAIVTAYALQTQDAREFAIEHTAAPDFASIAAPPGR
ncbi:MAG: hypothetical protein JNJ73_14600 [Hyphomonadaceae bacterium]|nr:hypothetical protein [Hyphomonadaceae bacterium]